MAQLPDIAGRTRVRIFYSGHVQGVGFRYTAKTVAAGYDVTGLVRNLPDGRVELVAEGAREELDAFRAERFDGKVLEAQSAGFIDFKLRQLEAARPEIHRQE